MSETFPRLQEWTPNEVDSPWGDGSNIPEEVGVCINGSSWGKIADSVTVGPQEARIITYAPKVINAASDLVEALIRSGFGETSDRALPGEFDTLVLALRDVFPQATGAPQ